MTRPISDPDTQQALYGEIGKVRKRARRVERRPGQAAAATTSPYMQMSAGVNMGTITASTYNDGVEGDQWVWNDAGAEFFEELSPGTVDHGIRILAHARGGLYYVRCHLGLFRDAGTAGNYPRWVRLDVAALGVGATHYENSTAVTGGADTPLELTVANMFLQPEGGYSGTYTDVVPNIRVIDGADDYLFRVYLHIYRLGDSGWASTSGVHDNVSP